MNLCACLGVGPGHQLLLGPVTAATQYVVAPRPVSPAPVRVECGTLRPAHTRRPKRTAAESKALHARIAAYIKAGIEAKRDPFELRDEIAEQEGIARSYVDCIVSKLGLAGKRRSADEIKALLAKAKALMTSNPKWTKRRVATELGVEECYLHVIMSRHGG